MSAYPSLPLFTDAFIADTGHLSAQETGAYLMLMMVAWRSPDCHLPDNDEKLARWARVDRRTWLRIKPAVMEFWTLADGFWSQKRLSKERDFVSKRAEVNRRNGDQGGRPKSLKNNDTQNPAGSSRVSETEAPNPSPSPTDQTGAPHLSDPRGGADYPPRAFDLWWERQPNKVGKDAARPAFERVRKSGRATFAELMDGLLRYIANKPPHRDYCNPATWLNQGRWDDAPAPAAPRGQPPPNGSKPSSHGSLSRAATVMGMPNGQPANPSLFADRGPVIDHEDDGRHDREVHEPAGGQAGRFSPQAALRLVSAGRH